MLLWIVFNVDYSNVDRSCVLIVIRFLHEFAAISLRRQLVRARSYVNGIEHTCTLFLYMQAGSAYLLLQIDACAKCRTQV